MTYVVPRQVDAWDLAERGMQTIRDYLRFLDATDRLHPASTRVPTLLKSWSDWGEISGGDGRCLSVAAGCRRRLHRCSGGRQTARCGTGGTRCVGERFSARDAAGRRPVLGELMQRHPEYGTGRLLIHDGQVAVLRAGMAPMEHLVWPDLACDCGCEAPAVSILHSNRRVV